MEQNLSKLLLLLFILTMSVTAWTKSNYGNFEDLPEASKVFVTHYFKPQDIEYVKHVNGLYRVVFHDGNELEFNAKGEWQTLKLSESSSETIPTDVIPSSIVRFVKKAYNGETIRKAVKTEFGFKVTLSKGKTLLFNKEGYLIDEF